MAKVDWITWKTNTDEIIDPNKIEQAISSKFNDYNRFMNTIIYEQIKSDSKNGGLDKESIVINDSSTAHEQVNKILNRIENVKTKYNMLINSIKNNANEQKEIEKNQLIEILENKIKEEKVNLEMINNNLVIHDELLCKMSKEECITEIKRRITELEERLNKVKEL